MNKEQQTMGFEQELERTRLKQAFYLIWEYPLEMAEQLALVKDQDYSLINQARIQQIKNLVKGKNA
jgi:hypothetical protein